MIMLKARQEASENTLLHRAASARQPATQLDECPATEPEVQASEAVSMNYISKLELSF